MKKVIIDRERMARSIERARKLKPMVRVLNLSQRVFLVESVTHPGKVYLVTFHVDETDGTREIGATCEWVNNDTLEPIEECKGMLYAGTCYHVSSAAGVNIGIRQSRSGEARWAA